MKKDTLPTEKFMVGLKTGISSALKFAIQIDGLPLYLVRAKDKGKIIADIEKRIDDLNSPAKSVEAPGL